MVDNICSPQEVAGNGLANGTAMSAGPQRQSARGVIEQRIDRLRIEADRLQALLDALPARLPAAADDALWQMAIAQR